jgi:hypothetical protein
MQNYIDKLLSLQTQVLDAPKISIPYDKLIKLVSLHESAVFETEIKRLAEDLPFKTNALPSFGQYVDDWYMVELGEFKCNIFYCERGGFDLRSKCVNNIDLSFEIFRIIIPGYTASAAAIAKQLDSIADQRILIWLKMSSEIYYMYQVNAYFGLRVATYNVAWMCQELVRMGVFTNELDAFVNEEYILKGLMLSGMPNEFTRKIIEQIKL